MLNLYETPLFLCCLWKGFLTFSVNSFRAQHERYIVEQERRRQEHIRAQEAALAASSGKPSPVGSDGSRGADSRPSSTHPRDDSRERHGREDSRERPPSHGRHSTGPPPVRSKDALLSYQL